MDKEFEISVTNSNEIADIVKNEGGVDKVLKPLTDEIHLFDSFVSGTASIGADVIASLNISDKLTLRREANKFDDNAIAIYREDGTKIGYIPEKDNVIFARLMDAGKMLIGRVKIIDLKGHFTQITIGIYLVDF